MQFNEDQLYFIGSTIQSELSEATNLNHIRFIVEHIILMTIPMDSLMKIRMNTLVNWWLRDDVSLKVRYLKLARLYLPLIEVIYEYTKEFINTELLEWQTEFLKILKENDN